LISGDYLAARCTTANMHKQYTCYTLGLSQYCCSMFIMSTSLYQTRKQSLERRISMHHVCCSHRSSCRCLWDFPTL